MSNRQELQPGEQIGLLPPARSAKDGRSLSTSAVGVAPSRTGTYVPSGPPPGSFSSDLRTTTFRSELRVDYNTNNGEEDTRTDSERRQAELRDKIDKEMKIKMGTENLLEALNSKSAKQARDQKLRAESELNSSNRKIAELQLGLQAEIERSKEPPPVSPASRLSYLFKSAAPRPPSREQDASPEQEQESPTFVLAEILQALESEGMRPDYYVNYANELVELFKRHPTLKYDLVWSIFGLRVQTMLLSDSREVVAAGYRVMRYAITDRRSLQIIRGHHTDYLVIVSLVKESKASIEREQALKFIRAFLDVKDGVKEISPAIIRVITAVAEHGDDRLRNICTLTLGEILIRDPLLLVSSGGMSRLTDALGDGNYTASESLTGAFMYLLDVPARRVFLRSGHELDTPFAAFTDGYIGHAHEERLRVNAKVISALFKSWPGLITICMNDFLTVRSLLASLYIPVAAVRNVLLDLLADILKIKFPSWSTTFLAGRRLTTYGRVTNLKSEPAVEKVYADAQSENNRFNLVDHYTTVVLGVLLRSGLLPALLHAEEDAPTPALKKKTTLLLGEVLQMANKQLPVSWSASLQVLPELFLNAARFTLEERYVATGTIYQLDSVNRTLFRSGPNAESKIYKPVVTNESSNQVVRPAENPKSQFSVNMDETQFRALMVESQVLNTTNWNKWRWDLIQGIIEGPLLNPKRLDEALRVTKFVNRLFSFYRPFKYRFSDTKNTKPNQRYVRAGAALVRTLLQNVDGLKALAENKMIRQVAECLAQYDRFSGLTSTAPLFSPENMLDKLVGGYFTILSPLTSDPKGIVILERWRIPNIFYHLVERGGREDLIRPLLSNLDYALDSHPRVLLSKAMTACSKELRIFATRLLRKYATQPLDATDSAGRRTGIAEWAIKLLVTQLYDPEIEVCEAAIKLLEEACNQRKSLEYVVKCRPALDHLGEIGAPLLLRFLSTSVGYHYLDGLDYITQEMDDWFLGRNDKYVGQVEASLARALAESSPNDKPTGLYSSNDEQFDSQDCGIAPPHFYRELTRTAEGCKLLEEKGHFDEFVVTIRDFRREDTDPEIILKVKGCLWAVGNVGSMDLGAPFLEGSEVVKWIIQIAETSEVMSLRGTAFFVLGLISRSLHGQEILAEHNWDCSVSMTGQSLGWCIPLDFGKLFAMKPWAARATNLTIGTSSKDPTADVMDDDPTNARILSQITDLGNTVLSKKAAAELHAIKSRKAPGFSRPSLFHRVMKILEAHHFHLQAQRFVIDLFDKGVMRRIVLEEEELDEEIDNEAHVDGEQADDGSSEDDSDHDV